MDKDKIYIIHNEIMKRAFCDMHNMNSHAQAERLAAMAQEVDGSFILHSLCHAAFEVLGISYDDVEITQSKNGKQI